MISLFAAENENVQFPLEANGGGQTAKQGNITLTVTSCIVAASAENEWNEKMYSAC